MVDVDLGSACRMIKPSLEPRHNHLDAHLYLMLQRHSVCQMVDLTINPNPTFSQEFSERAKRSDCKHKYNSCCPCSRQTSGVFTSAVSSHPSAEERIQYLQAASRFLSYVSLLEPRLEMHVTPARSDLPLAGGNMPVV